MVARKPHPRTDMPNVRSVTVELTEEQIADLQAAVNAGMHATTSVVVQEAIADWQIKHALRDEEVQRLRELWDEGRADGVTRPFDVECILASARTRKTGTAAE